MNIVHVYDGHEHVYDGRGSVPAVVWHTAREAAARGHDVTVIERQWAGLDTWAVHEDVVFERIQLRTGANEPWIRVPYKMVEHPASLLRLLGDRINFAIAALRRLHAREFDAVHAHLPFAANVLVTIAPQLRERMVYSAHLGELRLDELTDDQRRTTPIVANRAGGGRGNERRHGHDSTNGTSHGRESEGDAAESDATLSAPSVVQAVSPDIYLATRVARTTVLNDDIWQAFVDRGVAPEAVTVVPDGVDLNRFGSVPDDRLAATRDAYDLDDGPIALFVGTIMPRKGVDDLIEAVVEVIHDRGFETLQVVVAGEDELDGAYTDEVRAQIVAEGLNEHVQVTGFVPDDLLPALYTLADVFVLPSREEGFGMTVTEAMAAGTPIIASDVGGLADQVTDGEQGYLVSPNAPGEVADRVARLLADADERADFAAQARDCARTFSWDAVGERFETIYAEVAR
jgi:glycosyltransferase involved in cell wall biosynthesis